MRIERLTTKLFVSGWIVSGLIGVAAYHEWKGRLQAVQDKLTEAERTREAVVQRVAAEERLRIARELHDSLTHSISVVKVQAGVAAHLARKRGEEVPEALLAIEQAAGDASRELRETLGVLRRETSQGSGLHGLDDLPALLERSRASGLEVTLQVTGSRREVPPEVDGAAYRIVQEALTNVSRHAGDTAARVRVTYRPERLTVQVDDDGVGLSGAPSGSGLGLIGMRERAAALGGTLVAQGRPGGGFTVRAELPAVPAAEPALTTPGEHP